MKNLTRILFLLCLSISAYPQQGKFWGTTYGAFGDGGKIFKFNPDGSGVKIVKTFSDINIDGTEPYETDLFLASDNKMYGVTAGGGRFGKGVIYSINPADLSYTKLHDFSFEHSRGGTGSLVEAPDGFIYGYVDYNHPKIFKIRKDGSDYEELTIPWSFYLEGNRSGLTRGSDGNLYGIGNPTNSDKSYVFKLTTAGVFTKTYEFAAGTGPTGKMIMGSGGKLWGTSTNLKIFAVNLNGGNFATITVPTSGSLGQGLIEGPGNILYGIVTDPDMGVDYAMFKVATNGTGFAVIHNFEPGEQARGTLAIEDNTIYGSITDPSPAKNYIYKINTNGTGYASVTALSQERGATPGGVTLGPNHTLYAANHVGGEGDFGTIVKVNTDGSDFSIIQQFWKRIDGMVPGTNLELLPNGEILGVAAVGGSTSEDPWKSGVIFKIQKDDSYHIIHEFDGVTGAQPIDAPIAGPGGFYYGITWVSGSSDAGIIYKIKPDGTDFQKIHDFKFSEGAEPRSGLIVADGRLYGMTNTGGSGIKGTIYGIDPDGSNFQVLLNLNDANGANPDFQKLVFHDGFLYASISGGTNGDGVLFKIKPDGTGYTKLFELSNTDFSYPATEPFIEEDGDIIIVATRGGDKDRGGIIRYNKNGSFDVLHDFDVTLPDAEVIGNGHLTLGPDGSLYGMEPNGGSAGTGTAFKMNADGTGYTRIELNINDNPLGFMSPWRGFLFVPGVDKITQTINFPEPSTSPVAGGTLQLNATASSALTVTYTASPSDRITIAGSVASLLKAGHVTITASQSGDDTYLAAAPVEKTICIAPPKPSITVSGITLTSNADTGNHWQLNGEAIPDANGKTYAATVSGSYTLVTSVDGCVSATSDATKLTITGLGDEPSLSIHVFPNPAANEIFVRTPHQSSVKILDVTGRVIGHHIVNANSDHKFDISSLSNGIYFLRIESSESVTTKRFSKL